MAILFMNRKVHILNFLKSILEKEMNTEAKEMVLVHKNQTIDR